MFANFATAIPTGAAMTFLLIFAMQSLISMQPMTVDERPRYILKPFKFVPPDEKLNLIDFDPADIPEVVPTPPIETSQQYPSDGQGISIPTRPPIPRESGSTLANPYGNDGPLVVIVRVQPTYPTAAATNGLEGFVTVMFDVFADGTVGNISILESSSRQFERSAIQAASRFRYKARVVDGVPQISTGVRYRFTYKMDD